MKKNGRAYWLGSSDGRFYTFDPKSVTPGSKMKPTRTEVEQAIKTAGLWTEGRDDSERITFHVKKLRDLVTAARWALELVDEDNLPLLPEDMKHMKVRVRK
jgi:hypothetical protein